MRIASLALAMALTGCATQGVSTNQYAEGPSTKVDNERVVDAAYSEVWDGLVKELAKSFYVINNIDKESRIINLSFSSAEAQEYVDCGRTVRTYKEGDKVETFDYAFAAKSSFKVAADHQEHPAFTSFGVVNRTPQLDGRANIYLAPVAGTPDRTTVTVNTRYVLTVRASGQAFARHVSGNIQGRGFIPEQKAEFAFNTNAAQSFDAGGGTRVTCAATGKFEADVLGLVRK